PKLNVKSREEAHAFLKTYGYDVEVPSDREKMWQIHSRAVIFLRTQLLGPLETIPDEIADPKKLDDIANLLMLASMPDSSSGSLHRCTCALLRVIHVVSQLQNDLFNYFSLEIQEDIFRPYRRFVQKDSVSGIRLMGPEDGESIALKKFDMKP